MPHAGAPHLYRARAEARGAFCASTIATAAWAFPSFAMLRGGWAIRWSSSRSSCPATRTFTRQLQVIQDSRADAIVLWTDEAASGPDPEADARPGHEAARLRLLSHAGARRCWPRPAPAAEGFEAVFPYDPTRNDPRWLDFNRRFEARFHEQPEQFASLAYDAMNALLDSICKAGLNRARIHDALADIEQYDGVTGHMIFDPNQKNVAPMYLGTVHNGAITYRPASMKARRDSNGAGGCLAVRRLPTRAWERMESSSWARTLAARQLDRRAWCCSGRARSSLLDRRNSCRRCTRRRGDNDGPSSPSKAARTGAQLPPRW